MTSEARTAQELAEEAASISRSVASYGTQGAYLLSRRLDAISVRLAALASQAEPVGWREFIEDVAKQTPEKPDYWSSCGQCDRNSGRAEELLEATPPTPAQAEPTMADAIAAGDGTLHGAIDYWQQRALKAEQSEPSTCTHEWRDFYTGPNRTHLICAKCEAKNPAEQSEDTARCTNRTHACGACENRIHACRAVEAEQSEDGRDAARWLDAVRSAEHLCPLDMSHPDKLRWKASYIRAAIAAKEQS